MLLKVSGLKKNYRIVRLRSTRTGVAYGAKPRRLAAMDSRHIIREPPAPLLQEPGFFDSILLSALPVSRESKIAAFKHN